MRRAAFAHQNLINVAETVLKTQRGRGQPDAPCAKGGLIHKPQRRVAIRRQTLLPRTAGERVMRPQVFDVKHFEATVLGRVDRFPKVNELAARKDVTSHEQAGLITLDALRACNRMIEKKAVRGKSAKIESRSSTRRISPRASAQSVLPGIGQGHKGMCSSPRRHRRPARFGVHPIELLRHRSQNLIHHLSDPPQRMILRYTLLQRNVAEHFGLLLIVSTHKTIIA